MTGRDYILAGVGEDVSFDIELITRYSGKGYLIDPTPRACKHISQIRSRFGVLNDHSYSENTGIQKVSAYNLGSINDENFLHYPYALWRLGEKKVDFYPRQILVMYLTR